MLAKYEWQDETGLRHPSLVAMDQNNNVLLIKQIWACRDYFEGPKLNKRKLPRIRGYSFETWDHVFSAEEYSLRLIYHKLDD